MKTIKELLHDPLGESEVKRVQEKLIAVVTEDASITVAVAASGVAVATFFRAFPDDPPSKHEWLMLCAKMYDETANGWAVLKATGEVP